MSRKSDRDTYIELLDEVANWVVGLGLISLTIFPLALPLIALTAILAIPVVVGGLLVAVLAAPVLLVRRIWRSGRARRAPSPAVTEPAVTEPAVTEPAVIEPAGRATAGRADVIRIA